MEKRLVGENAGKVWQALNGKKDGISIQELSRRLQLSEEQTALAIGWLARENKICLERRDGILYLREGSFFNFCFG